MSNYLKLLFYTVFLTVSAVIYHFCDPFPQDPNLLRTFLYILVGLPSHILLYFGVVLAFSFLLGRKFEDFDSMTEYITGITFKELVAGVSGAFVFWPLIVGFWIYYFYRSLKDLFYETKKVESEGRRRTYGHS